MMVMMGMVKVVMMNMFQDNRREYSIPDLFNKVLSSLTSFSLYFMIVITIIMVMTITTMITTRLCTCLWFPCTSTSCLTLSAGKPYFPSLFM